MFSEMFTRGYTSPRPVAITKYTFVRIICKSTQNHFYFPSFIRISANLQYSAFSSIITLSLPKLFAAAPVAPDPASSIIYTSKPQAPF